MKYSREMKDMRHTKDLLIAMTVIMAVLIGPALAQTIEIDTCIGEGAFGIIPLAPGEVCQEGVYSNGPSFYISEDGTIEYIGEPVEENSFTSLNYVTWLNHAPQFKTMWITLLACVVVPDVCEHRFSDWDDNIQIDTPVIGESVTVNWDVPDANGCWSGAIYENGILNRGRWKGTFPVEVVYTERDWDTYLPTGRVIIDGTCGE